MRKIWKQIVSMAMVSVMLMSMLPTTVLATSYYITGDNNLGYLGGDNNATSQGPTYTLTIDPGDGYAMYQADGDTYGGGGYNASVYTTNSDTIEASEEPVVLTTYNGVDDNFMYAYGDETFYNADYYNKNYTNDVGVPVGGTFYGYGGYAVEDTSSNYYLVDNAYGNYDYITELKQTNAEYPSAALSEVWRPFYDFTGWTYEYESPVDEDYFAYFEESVDTDRTNPSSWDPVLIELLSDHIGESKTYDENIPYYTYDTAPYIEIYDANNGGSVDYQVTYGDTAYFYAPSGDIELKANWTPKEFPVMFQSGVGSFAGTAEVVGDGVDGLIEYPGTGEGLYVDYGELSKGPYYRMLFNYSDDRVLPTDEELSLTRTGYHFVGWEYRSELEDDDYDDTVWQEGERFNNNDFLEEIVFAKTTTTEDDVTTTTYYNMDSVYTEYTNPISLYAQWEANTYSIILKNSLNGAEIYSQGYNYAASGHLDYTGTPTSGVDYLVFDKWIDEDGNDATETIETYKGFLNQLSSVDGDEIVFYAIWKDSGETGDDPSVTYNGGGYDVLDADTFKGYNQFPTGSSFVIPAEIPEIESGEATFDNWESNVEIDGKTSFAPGDTFTMPAVDVTLTAQWTDCYDLTFDYLPEGAVIAPSDTPTKPQSDQSNIAPGTTITFGTAPTSSDSTPAEESDQYKGYIFVGWSTDVNWSSDSGGTLYKIGDTFTMSDEDITLYAQWTYTYRIYYYDNLDSINASNIPYYQGNLEVDSEVTLSTKEPYITASYTDETDGETYYYVFSGWSTTADGPVEYDPGDSFTVPEGNTSMYAQWDRGYKVTYIKEYTNSTGTAYSSTLTTQTKILEGDTVTITTSTPTRTDRDDDNTKAVFAGWVDTDGDIDLSKAGQIYYKTEEFIMPAQNVTLYSTWSPLYAVTYLAGQCGDTIPTSGAVTLPTYESVETGETATVTDEIPTWSGYAFTGWVDNKDAPWNAGDTFTMPDEPVKIIATWGVGCDLTYDTNTTDVVSYMPQNVVDALSGTELTISEDVPSRYWYTFTGWNTATDGTGISYASGESILLDGDETLYAQWTKNADADDSTYTVIYTDWSLSDDVSTFESKILEGNGSASFADYNFDTAYNQEYFSDTTIYEVDTGAQVTYHQFSGLNAGDDTPILTTEHFCTYVPYSDVNFNY